MSQNFFAALDDSGDEAPSPAKATTNTKKRDPKPPKAVADPSSKPDNRRNTKQNNHDKHDRNTKYGRGGGRGQPRDGKRQYDRRSGTGRGREIKKGGGGARNWGNEKDEAKKREGKIDEDKIDDTEPKEETTERAEGDGNPDAAEGEPEPEPKPEDNTMTFEEYMASKGQKEGVQLREVENEFKGKAAAKKVEEDFLVMGGGKQKKGKKKNTGEKQKVEVGFRTAPSDTGGGAGYRDGGRGRGGRGRSDRGGRGGGRGGRDGRGRGGRGGRGRGSSKNYVPNVQDTNAFPSL